MLLRSHPLFHYHGVTSWPPVWACTDSGVNDRPQGEIGVLKTVQPSSIQPADRRFLHIDHEGSSYIGCLMVDDQAFYNQVVTLLKNHCNQPISEIGSLDISYNL